MIRGALLGVFVVAPGLLLLIVRLGSIVEDPSLLLWIIGIPVGLLVLMVLYFTAARISVPARTQPLPPESLTPPQPAPGRALSPTTVPGDGADSPGHGNFASFPALRRLPARWRYRSPPMRPPGDGNPLA